MEDHKLEFDTWDELDAIDTDIDENMEYTHTLEISEDVIKEAKEMNQKEEVDKKPGFFARMFGKKEKTDFSDLDRLEDTETEIEEVEFSESLVSEISDTLDLSNELLDRALEEVNENEQIKEILAQPTVELTSEYAEQAVEHNILDDIDEALHTIEVDDSHLDNIKVDEIEIEGLEEIKDPTEDIIVEDITEEPIIEEMVVENEEEITTEDEVITEVEMPTVSTIAEDNFDDAKHINLQETFADQEVIIEADVPEAIEDTRSVSDVILPDTMMAAKFARIMDPIFENSSRADIKELSFAFLNSEVAKVVKYSKKKMADNNLEYQVLKEEIARRDEKIRILQEQLGNPLENYNRFEKQED